MTEGAVNVTPGGEPDAAPLGRQLLRTDQFDAYLDGSTVKVYETGGDYSTPVHTVELVDGTDADPLSAFVARAVDEAQHTVAPEGDNGQGEDATR